MDPMTLQTLVSIAMLGAFIWAVGFLLPKAIREHDGLALTSAILTAILALFLWLWVGVGTRASAWSQTANAQQKHQSLVQPEEACRPAALRDFCRVWCADPAPTLTRRVEPDLKKLQRPLPRGAAILEVGIDLEGRVVSACVVRGLRNDFDRAAQAAVRQGQWKVGQLKGKERGFVLYVSVCTPDKKCGPAPAERPHTDLLSARVMPH